MTRKVLLVSSSQSLDKAELVIQACSRLISDGFLVMFEKEQIESLKALALNLPTGAQEFDGSAVELAIVLGGDGSILRAAEILRGTGSPILGINAGHVGFMAEAESGNLVATLDAVAARKYEVDRKSVV